VGPHLECNRTRGASSDNGNIAAAAQIASAATSIHRLPTTDHIPELVCVHEWAQTADHGPQTMHIYTDRQPQTTDPNLCSRPCGNMYV
jgi:hypothetical protein